MDEEASHMAPNLADDPRGISGPRAERCSEVQLLQEPRNEGGDQDATGAKDPNKPLAARRTGPHKPSRTREIKMSNHEALEAVAALAQSYGVCEENSLAYADYTHEGVDYAEGDVPLSDLRIVSIDRIRFLTERGYPFMDLSYCYGTLRDGRHVRVDLGSTQFRKNQYKADLIRCASDAHRYAKGLGMFDADTISILWG